MIRIILCFLFRKMFLHWISLNPKSIPWIPSSNFSRSPGMWDLNVSMSWWPLKTDFDDHCFNHLTILWLFWLSWPILFSWLLHDCFLYFRPLPWLPRLPPDYVFFFLNFLTSIFSLPIFITVQDKNRKRPAQVHMCTIGHSPMTEWLFLFFFLSNDELTKALNLQVGLAEQEGVRKVQRVVLCYEEREACSVVIEVIKCCQ